MRDGGPPGVRIEVLDRARLERALDAIVAIDRLLPREFAEPWLARHFRAELPGKWSCSLLASDASGVIAFAVRSIKGNLLHGHRAAVRSDRQGLGIGTLLYVHSGRIGLAHGCRHLTVKVASGNRAAVRLHERLGGRMYGVEGPNALFIHDCAALAER